jgi:hypothetical protein
MSFDVGQFRSQMVGDGARPNLFEVIMPFPTLISDSGSVEKFTFMCRATQLPGSTLGAVNVNYFGREVKFAGNRTFPDWTVTVINDEDFIVRNTIERWMAAINTHGTNIRTSPMLTPWSYTVDPTVVQYGKTGNIIKEYNFVGMFPVDLSPIDVDWGANDTMEEFSITFAYQWWTAVEIGIN